ncbi:MAG: HDIG domain-containing metalloprotein [candidate division WOR-3 bacterium]
MVEIIKSLIRYKPWYKLLPKGSYLVGGAIRDIMLGKVPTDWDIAVWNPEETGKSIAMDLKGVLIPLDEGLGIFRVVLEDEQIDLTPITGTIYDDLYKRDFTINSIAISLDSWEIIDVFGGLKDLQSGIIRITLPENLEEDPLRMLRAFRFSAELGFEIEGRTFFEISSRSHLITKVSPERITYELTKILSSENFYKQVSSMAESGILFKIFPELEGLKKPLKGLDVDVWSHTLLALRRLEISLKTLEDGPFVYYLHRMEAIRNDKGRFIIVMGTMFHDVGKPATYKYENGEISFHGHDYIGSKIVNSIGKRLRMPKEIYKAISLIVAEHMHPHLLATPDVTRRALYRYYKRTGEWAFPIILVAYVDALATSLRAEGVAGQLRLAKKLEDFLKQQEAEANKPPRLITGYDLMERGLKPGPIYKKILQEIEELRAEGVVKTREEALKVLDDIIKKYSA